MIKDTDTVSDMKTKMVKAFVDKCPTCGKEIIALTENRVEGLMTQHRLLTHPTTGTKGAKGA
jgi:hypothetical protein